MKNTEKLSQWLKKGKDRILAFCGIGPEIDEAEETPWQNWQYIPPLYVVTLKTNVFLSRDDIGAIISKALDGGIERWCSEIGVMSGRQIGVISNLLPQDEILRLKDIMGETHKLTYQKFLMGLCRYITLGGDVMRKECGMIDVNAIDKTAVDAILQYSLYGEVLF